MKSSQLHLQRGHQAMDERPRPSWWYENEPFDPNVTFVVDGVTARYMDSPCAEHYVFEPVDRFLSGGLPPAEREVRDHLLVAHFLRTQIAWLEYWWSQFFQETENFKAARDAFKNLEALCAKSPEHRAAFMRMANGDIVPETIRVELRKIVRRHDKVLASIEGSSSHD